MGASSAFWTPVIGALARVSPAGEGSFSKGRLVIAPDMIGFGRSIPGSPEHPPDFISWLRAFLDALGLKKVDLAGHSLGGAIALRFTLEHPERVERIVLVGAIGFGASLVGVLAAGLFMVPSNPVTRPILRRMLSSRPGLIPSVPRGKKRKPSFDRGMAMRIMRATGWNGLPSFRREELSRISQPVLLLWGEKDAIVPLSIAKRLMGNLRRAQLKTVSGGGHMPFLENPTEFTEKLSEFLDSEE